MPLNRANELVQIEHARKIVHGKKTEAQEFEEICHDLGYFNVSNDLSTGLPSYVIDIALLEENRELLTKSLEELKAIETSRASQKQ